MRTINIKLIGSILLFTVGILLFSLSIQKYQVLTSSQAAIGIPQCTRPSGTSTPSNIPCGSCSISDSQPSGSTVTVSFSCEILCNTSGNASTLTGCPANTIPHNITDTSWFWCSGAGGAACTENSPDLRKKGSFTGGGPWIITKQGTTNFAATFLVDGFQNCGRIQTDVNMTQIAGHVEDLKTNCDTTQPTQTKTPTLPVPTSTPSDEVPTDTPTDEEPTLTPYVYPTTVASSNTPVPTRTPTPTSTPIPPTATRTPTPTFTPTPTRTPTPVLTATLTPTGTLTPSPTGTPVLATVTPGGPTLTPTGVSGVTGTATATIAPTTGSNIAQVPQNTLAPIIYEVTVTPVRNLTVNRQAPGITPWALLAVPVIMVIVGLFL